MIRRFNSRQAAQTAIDIARGTGRIDRGQPHSANGYDWHAHVRKGTFSFCL